MNTNIFKEKLQKELTLVEQELEKVARRNPEHPNVWEALESADVDRIDDDSVAADVENFSENMALTDNLQTQYDNILAALKKIEAGKYGICEVGGEIIAEDRLMAVPSARTCIEHSKK
jgi:RNA polymerase-binding transcription factor DksA